MSVPRASRRSIAQVINSASTTIDLILNKGAEKLYDKYIYSKVSSQLSNKLADFIDVLFDPVANTNHQRINKKDERIHEAVVNKINLAYEAKNNRNYSSSQNNSIIHQSILNKSSIRQKRQLEKTRKTKNGQKNSQVKLRPQSKESTGCRKLFANDERNNESIEFIRNDKAKRFDEEKERIIEDKRSMQQTQRHWSHLQQQLKQAQQNSQNLAFDYDTCHIIPPEPQKTQKMQQEKKHKPKNNMIYLKFEMQEDEDRVKSCIPKQNDVKNIRKITSFDRSRRNKHQEADNQNYNNNGQRQYSTIPYLQIEEGVKMTESDNKMAQRPQTSRKPGTASTHRTFKSYTRQRLQSLGGFRTIDVVASAGNTRYQQLQSKQQKRTANQTPKRSLLWSSRNCAKDHRISKNMDHFGVFFDFSEETIE